MIQILGIRPVTGGYKCFGKAPSIIELVENYEPYLSKIPENERANLFFTPFQCKRGQKLHAFKEQWVIPFDIDGVVPSESQPVIDPRPYVGVIAKTLGLREDETGAIFSGHGLHLIVALKTPFTSVDFFTENRPHYEGVCALITEALEEANLPGYAEPGLFNQGALGFRMPGTQNQKKDKPPVTVQLLQRRLVPVEFDLKKLSGLPDIPQDDQVKPTRVFKVDTQAVLEGCNFLKAWKTEPETMREPNWYAMLSVVGRCEDGAKLADEYSKGFDKYSPEGTEKKLSQALKASGPRTCKSIDKDWGKCKDCPNFEKVKSPIDLKGEDYIETQDSGFHKTFVDDKGNLKVGKPEYSDLRLFFDQKFHYKCLGATKTCYIWTGTHYQEYDYLETFAQEHFKPYAHSGMTEEFKRLVWRTNIELPEWWARTSEKKINFKNCVLDLRSGDLWPHDKDMGFRYVLPYDYNQDASCPAFLKFLEDVTCKDTGLQNIILEFLGYAFSGERCRREVLVLTGEGFNGKSTFLDLIRALGGPTNISNHEMSALKNETNCQDMEGKLLNVSDETHRNSWEDTEYFKNLSAGGKMKCRQLYHKGYHVTNKTKFILTCNELPKSTDASKAFFSRLLIVPFLAEFPARVAGTDKNMLEKLCEELPGIFNLVLKGYKRWVKQDGFSVSETVDRAVEEFRMETDHAARWIKENIICHELNGGEKFIWKREAYQAYRTAMTNEGVRDKDILTSISFGKKLKQVIPDSNTRIVDKKQGATHDRIIKDSEFSDPREY